MRPPSSGVWRREARTAVGLYGPTVRGLQNTVGVALPLARLMSVKQRNGSMAYTMSVLQSTPARRTAPRPGSDPSGGTRRRAARSIAPSCPRLSADAPCLERSDRAWQAHISGESFQARESATAMPRATPWSRSNGRRSIATEARRSPSRSAGAQDPRRSGRGHDLRLTRPRYPQLRQEHGPARPLNPPHDALGLRRRPAGRALIFVGSPRPSDAIRAAPNGRRQPSPRSTDRVAGRGRAWARRRQGKASEVDAAAACASGSFLYAAFLSYAHGWLIATPSVHT
jgi:hypothetical protein